MTRNVCRFTVLAAAAVLSFAPYPSGVYGEDGVDAPVSLVSASTATSDVPGKPCSDACASSEAGCCPSAFGTCRPNRHWVVETEAVWFSRQRNQRVATFDVLDGAGDSVSSYSASGASGNDLVASPRLLLGVQGDCWGMDVRYWRMREPTISQDINAVLLDTDIAASSFTAETLDLEATRRFTVGATEMQFALGARYAQLEQASAITESHVINDNLFAGQSLASYGFHGAGLTSALTMVRPIGDCHFNLFCNLRASMLWDGNATNRVTATALYGDGLTGGWAEGSNEAMSSSEANLFVGEVQLGGQWNIPLKCMPANAFVRSAVEYQYWGTSNSGGAEAETLVGATGGPYSYAYGRSTETYVSLVGFNVAAGITW